MRRRVIVASGSLAGLAIGAAVWIGVVASRPAPVRWEPAPCLGVRDPPLLEGLVAGVIRLPDCRPAVGANVYLDAYFHSMGEKDDVSAAGDMIRPAARNEKGEWKWLQPGELPKHAPFTVSTDSEGRFAFAESAELQRVLERDRIKVWATHEDLVAPKVVIRGERVPMHLPDLVLGPSIRYSVRLVTLDGDPVVDAYVDLGLRVPGTSGDDELRLLYSLGARTDERGVAILPAVPVRPDWQVSLRANPREMPRFIDHDVPRARPEENVPLEFRLSRGFTIRGRVLLPDGSAGSDVVISSRRDSDPDPNSGHSTTTWEDGSFELAGVPTNDATVTFVHMGAAVPPTPGIIRHVTDHAPARLTRRMSGREGGVVDLGTVELSATRSITGVVLDPSGKPAAEGWVLLDKVGHGRNLTSEGRFEIHGVEPGRHSLTATIYEGPGRREGELAATVHAVEAGSKDVVIRVSGGGNLVVRFHPAGKPGEPLEVRAPKLLSRSQGGGGPDSKETEIRQTFDPGRLDDLRVAAEGYKTKMLGPVVILPDRKTVVDIELQTSP